jgi:hypothetical protein
MSLLPGGIAWAAPAAAPAPKPSVLAIVVADDKNAEIISTRMMNVVEDTLGKSDKYNVTLLKDAAGDAVSAEARAAEKAGEDQVSSGKSALADGKFDVAETALHNAVKSLELGAAALDKLDIYADAWGYLAAAHQGRGADDDAKDAAVQAMCIKPTWKPEGKTAASAPFNDVLKEARKESAENHRGSAFITTVPSGGRVYVDNEFKGYAPVTVERLTLGKHIFKFERPGYTTTTQVDEVNSTDDAQVKGHFTATHDYADMESVVNEAAQELQTAVGPNSLKVLSRFKVDRAIIGEAKTVGDNVVLDLTMVDAKTKKRLAHRKNSFEDEQYGTLNREVEKLTQGLLADAEDAGKGQKKVSGKDPLEDRSGMEDWDDDSPTKRKTGDE